MGYVDFLNGLFEEGRVTAPAMAPLSDAELADGDNVLRQYEQIWRLDMPGQAPAWSAAASRWAARMVFRASQCAVFRDVDGQMLDQLLGEPLPDQLRSTPSVHYSVDLLFRYLPDLTRLARSAAEQDPLLEHLRRWARQWPLSSVGMSDVGEVSLDGWAECPCLLQLYVDRVLASGDKSRLSDDRVRAAVQTALGMHAELHEPIHAALQTHSAEGSDT